VDMSEPGGADEPADGAGVPHSPPPELGEEEVAGEAGAVGEAEGDGGGEAATPPGGPGGVAGACEGGRA
jgi:hypothetical protein